MGIYVFTRAFCSTVWNRMRRTGNRLTTLGKNIIPQMVEHDKVYAYPFSGYWVDVGTISAYWETNLALLGENPALDLYDPGWVLHTRSKSALRSSWDRRDNRLIVWRQWLCARRHGDQQHLSPGSRVERGAVVRDSGHHERPRSSGRRRGGSCVLDKEIEIGAGAQVGAGDDNTPNQLEPANIKHLASPSWASVLCVHGWRQHWAELPY